MTIYDDIRKEREYQDNKWGHEADDTLNTPWMWAAYIARYSTNWMKGTFLPIGTEVTDAFRASMIKVAALAIAAIESLDRQRELQGKAFFE